jgi:hypothetical protein
MRRNKMATYLRQEISSYAKSITVEIDFNKFSNRQIKNMIKYIRNGHVSKGDSATSTIVRWVFKKYSMPHFLYGRWWSDWKDIPNGHAFFETLKGVASVAKLTADNYDSNRIAEDIINADAQKPSGDMRMGSYEEHAVKQIKESMIIKNELPDEVNTFIDKLQNKTLGVVPVDFYEVANRY